MDALTVRGTGINVRDALKLFLEYRDEAQAIWALVQQWNEIDESPATPSGMEARVKLAVQIAKILTSISTTEKDDSAVDFLAKLLDNDALLNLLATIVARTMRNEGSVSALDVDTQNEFTAQGFDWSKISELLPLILAIFKLFQK